MADECFLYTGLIRLHVLHHVAQEPVHGLAIIEALGRHGYKVSPGTLYPIPHGLEERGYLTSTEAGKEALVAAKLKGRELFGELFEDDVK